MIKIMVTVRNRFEITKKCLEALHKHTTLPHQIYVYDNLTDYRVKDHFDFFCELYEKNIITQFTVNTKRSSFGAFSKAFSCNCFGKQHMMDPEANKCDYLVFIDNDMFVLPDWDKIISTAWQDVNKYKMDHIKVITQLPGGVKSRQEIPRLIAGHKAMKGILGGSGFWSVRPNFFKEVGFLDLKLLIGLNKKHDQMYWVLLSRASNKNPYILALDQIFVMNCGGSLSGSICNVLTSKKNDPNLKDLLKREENDENIASYSFDDFMKFLLSKKEGFKQW